MHSIGGDKMFTMLFGATLIETCAVKAFDQICLNIDSIVYWTASFAYRIFFETSQVNLFGNDELMNIINNIYIVLGVAMLFVFAYNILLLIINPDEANSKSD